MGPKEIAGMRHRMGMTNLQHDCPTSGNLILLHNTRYSVELYPEQSVLKRNNSTSNLYFREETYWDVENLNREDGVGFGVTGTVSSHQNS
jgi:hypothetical protein